MVHRLWFRSVVVRLRLMIVVIGWVLHMNVVHRLGLMVSWLWLVVVVVLRLRLIVMVVLWLWSVVVRLRLVVVVVVMVVMVLMVVVIVRLRLVVMVAMVLVDWLRFVVAELRVVVPSSEIRLRVWIEVLLIIIVCGFGNVRIDDLEVVVIEKVVEVIAMGMHMAWVPMRRVSELGRDYGGVSGRDRKR